MCFDVTSLPLLVKTRLVAVLKNDVMCHSFWDSNICKNEGSILVKFSQVVKGGYIGTLKVCDTEMASKSSRSVICSVFFLPQKNLKKNLTSEDLEIFVSLFRNS